MKDDADLLRRWAKTWRRASVELEAVRRREIQTLDTREAIRQIFEASASLPLPPAPVTSGLVEQQRHFSRLRRRS